LAKAKTNLKFDDSFTRKGSRFN